MKNYILTESELAGFADDSVRAEIRIRAATLATSDESVQIQSESGDIFDVVSGSIQTDDLAVALTDEQIREKREIDTLREAEIEHVEKDIKPLVMQRLRALARQEVREEIRELKNENLELKATVAKLRKEPPTSPENERPEQ